MDDDKKKPERMVPVMQDEATKPKSVVASLVGQVERKFAAGEEQAENEWRAARVKGQELATEFANTSADYKVAVARNKPENIGNEIKRAQQKIQADIAEENNRMEEAKAAAARAIEQATTGQKQAMVEGMKADLEMERLQKQIQDAKKVNLEDERNDLQTKKGQIEAELKTVAVELDELFMEDTEQAAARKRSLKKTQADLQTKFGAIEEALQKLAGDL